MKTQVSLIGVIVGIAFCLSMSAAAAQGHGGTGQRRGPAAQPPPQQMEMQQKAGKEARQMQEEQQRQRDAAKAMGDKEIAGNRMLTAEERNRFTERMQSATSEGEREQIRQEHRNMILTRAQAAKGMSDDQIAGHRMLTAEERNRFTERMQSAASEGEREQIREETRSMILERARTEQQGKD
jgi:hypothetical protein